MMVLLNDIDCSTVLEKAVESAKLATRLDHEGHYDKALEHYDRAVRDLTVYVDNESCQVVVDCVLAKLQLYVQRAHVLRDFVEYGDSGECRDYAGGGGGSGGYIGTATRSPTTAAPQQTQLVAATGGSRMVAGDGADSACVSMKRCGDRARFDDSVSGSTSDSGVYELDSGRSSHNTSHDDAVADFEVSEMEVVCDRRPKENIVASGVAPLASRTDTGGATGWARSRSGDTHSRHKFLTACHHHMAELLQIVQDDAATADARCRAQERLDQIKRFADMYNSRLAVHSVDSRTARHPSSSSPAPSCSSSAQTRPALAAVVAAPCLSRASSLASLPSLSAVDIGDRVLAERRPCQRLVRVEVLHSAASVANRQLAAALQQQQLLPARPAAAAAASSRGRQQGGQDAICRRSPQSEDMQDFPRLPLDGSDDFQSPSTFGSTASVNTVADYYAETRVKVAQSPPHYHQHHYVQSADQLDAIEPATPSVALAKPTITQATPSVSLATPTIAQATPTVTRASSSDEHVPSASLAHSPPPAAVAADVTSTMYTFESQHLADYFDGDDVKELYEKPGLFWHLLGCLCG